MELLLDLLKMVLEYIGWEEEEIEDLLRRQRRRRGRNRTIVRRIASEFPSFHDFQLFTKRSLVREIGSRLPLKPCRRPHLQLAYGGTLATASPVIEKPRSQLMMMSLADVGWIADMEDSFRSQNHQITDILDKECSQKNTQDIKNELVNSQPNDAAMEKISALEGELERLKAQIAMLVQCPQSQAPMFQMPMTSTPCTPSAPLPPPPPPPPPPPVTPCNTPMKSVAQIIRENKAKNPKTSGPLVDKPTGGINMAEVLKGLNQVKLRTVERSPGGTPIRPKPLATEGNDPASIIARALKKKFAHKMSRNYNYSPDKENSPVSSFSPRSPSPQKVPFGPHLLKGSKGRRRSSPSIKKRSSLSRPALSPIN